jgi:hypothetical protein
MLRPHVRRGIAGLAAVFLVTTAALVAWGPPRQGPTGLQADEPPPKKREAGKPIAMATDRIGLEVELGLTDDQRTDWDGEVEVSEGKVTHLEVQRPPNGKANGAKYTVFTVRRMPPQQPQPVIIHPVLRITLDAPPTATVTLKTKQGTFSFTPAGLADGQVKEYLGGRASAERQDPAVRLTGRDTEDDFPVMAQGKDGRTWLAYVEYQPGRPIVMERVRAGNFEELAPTGNGDQIRLVEFDGSAWQPGVDVTSPGLNVWRPAVAVDGKGDVIVAWSQQIDGDWEVFYRRYTPPAAGQPGSAGRWSDVVRLTNSPGADFHVVAATDAAGVVWLAWQSWQKDNFDIVAAALADDHPYSKPRVISTSKANDWTPSIAADSKGNVYVAWDTYDKGNYDVLLRVLGKEDRTLTVAGSARFEARPHLAVDGKDRVWVAYEEGDEQWGKDYAHDGPVKNVGLEKNLGFALYVHRTVKVKCLEDGKLRQPAGDLEKAMATRLPWNKSVPRLAVDAEGGVWLLVRHHPGPTKQGEVWDSYALRYDGKDWSRPRRLTNSSYLMDNRPALVPQGKGLLAVYTSDTRLRTQNRDQDDLFAALLKPMGPTHDLQLVADAPPPAATLPPAHPDEDADVARIRDYRVDAGGKQLHLWRGEFHRHTEYTAHRDGDGLYEDAWRYALDAAKLDWIGVGDHDNGFGHEYFWWTMQKVTDIFQNPTGFVAVHCYERSVAYPNGHRNVIMPKRGVRPLPRTDLKGTPEGGTPDTKLLYAYLKHFGGVCASHTSATNMGTDWRDNDREAEPAVEIYQGHRHNYEHFGAPRSPTKDTQIGGYRPDGFVWNALEKGYRFGFECSSDHVSTHLSYAVLLTDDRSRQGVIDAFARRHCYGATDNIALVVRSGDHLMGDEFETKERPVLEIDVSGTAPVKKVHVVKNNKYVYTAEPGGRDVKGLRFTDMDAEAGKTSYYYVRVEQADGNLAWASPLWITYKP